MLTATNPYIKSLGNGLVMKSACHAHDVERLGAFDIQIFGQVVEGFTRALLTHHPATRLENSLYIEDESTEQIVAALCLIPWQWRYEDVTLKSGEVGIVGTLESYRNRGLIRALMARHRELLHEGDFDLSHIQGIPYFYRQFGYEYAMPLDAYWHLELRSLPEPSAESAYSFRLATLDDVPVLMRLYADMAATLDISTVRDADVWPYLLEYSLPTDTGAETWLVLDAAKQPVGYFRLPFHGFGNGLIVSEVSRMSNEIAEAVLVHLKGVALARNKPHIRLALPDTSNLVRVAHWFNVRNDGCYPWQIHLVDVARLLRKLTPVLERRIAASPFAGLTRTICLNLYREAFELCFEKGKLLAVNAIGFSDKGEIKMPPLLLAPLLLGYRSREELSHMYPDIIIDRHFRDLVDVMFPKLKSFIFTIY